MIKFPSDEWAKALMEELNRGQPRTWRKVIDKKLDPIQGLRTRQLQLTGNLGMIMKNVGAAQVLVNCTTQICTEFA